MIVKGIITKAEKPPHERARYSRYLLIETESGELGVQVRPKQRNKYFQYLEEGSHIEAKVRFEHSEQLSRKDQKTVYHHNNIILDEIIE